MKPDTSVNGHGQSVCRPDGVVPTAQSEAVRAEREADLGKQQSGDTPKQP
jgi:hypothetical protein